MATTTLVLRIATGTHMNDEVVSDSLKSLFLGWRYKVMGKLKGQTDVSERNSNLNGY